MTSSVNIAGWKAGYRGLVYVLVVAGLAVLGIVIGNGVSVS